MSKFERLAQGLLNQSISFQNLPPKSAARDGNIKAIVAIAMATPTVKVDVGQDFLFSNQFDLVKSFSYSIVVKQNQKYNSWLQGTHYE